jgi:hypothetical protein
MDCIRWVLIAALAATVGCSSKTGSKSAKPGAPGSSGAGAGSGGTSAAPPGLNNPNQTCSTTGAMRTCCTGGTQTCNGFGEFATWGPCVNGKGATLTCNDPCGAGEFGPGCDAGTPVDSGSKCGPGEFGPGCGSGPPPALCSDMNISNEPEILQAFQPASGQSVAANGQIKVWITDERAAIIAPNEQVDATTGMITTPGDRTAKAADGYLWEPALYIAPQTAENGGAPHFPQVIKGWYNNMPPPAGRRPPAGAGVQVPGMDPPPAGATPALQYSTEYIWDVSALGLAPGTYVGEFVIHDGDKDRAVGCVTIVITR